MPKLSAFLSAVQSFIDDIQAKRGWVEELNEHSHTIARHMKKASAGEVTEALQKFAALFPRVPLVAAGLVAINCGSLIERGGDPAIAGPALLDFLPRINETGRDFYTRIRALAAGDESLLDELRQESADGADEAEGGEIRQWTTDEVIDQHVANEGWGRLANQFGPVLFQDHPESVLGHMSEDFFRLALIAHLSRSKTLRSTARSRPSLLEQTLQVDEAGGMHRSFLANILQVLDDELLLVIHVEQEKGYDVRIGGLSDNFQLHTLLAGALIGSPAQGWLVGTAPSKRAVAECRDADIAEGGGAQMTGAFNLCNWTALRPDGSLSEDADDAGDNWIWNEGCPAEIVPFEGRRIVLLGKPPYERLWRAGRQFCGMVGDLTVERMLGAAEVTEWLKRLTDSPRP